MKKNRRSKTKHPALKPELNLKSRYELIDYDYIKKLSEVEKDWLNKFTEEYVNASINTEDLSKNFHNTEELKKDCYKRNNARNRDILTRAKISGNHVSIDEMFLKKKSLKADTEETLFDKIDNFLDELEKADS